MMIFSKSKGVSNYLEISDIDIPNNYEAKMITHNELEYIPAVEVSELDGQRNLYVKVDGLSSLANRYGKSVPVMEDVKKLVMDLKKCLLEMRRYLLKPDSLVIDIQYILLDPNSNKHRFLYVPGSEKSFREQIKELFEEIMVLYDHKDREGVVYLYDLYSRFLGDNFTPELFCKLFNEEEKKMSVPEVKKEVSEAFDEIINDETDADIPPTDLNKSLYYSASIAIVIIGIVLFIFFGIPSLKFSALMVLALIIYIISDVISLKEEKEIDAVMEPRLEPKPMAIIPEPIREPIVYEEEKDTTMLSSQSTSKTVSKLVPIDAGEEIFLIEGETKIGRKKNMCDYYINDPSVSRVHAILEKRGDKVMVCDAGSTNGTYLNDIRLEKNEKTETARGDMISIAGIRYECC